MYGMLQIESNGFLYDMGTITGVTDNLAKAISAIAIPSLPSDCTFALESQTSNTYQFSYIRRNPTKIDGVTYERDPDYAYTSWKWTNADWVRRTSTLINRWQVRQGGHTMILNQKRDLSGRAESEVVGGVTANARYNTLYPVTNKNVMVKNISYGYSAGDTDTIHGTITLQVGGMLSLKQDSNNSTSDVVFNLTKLALKEHTLDTLTGIGPIPVHTLFKDLDIVPLFGPKVAYNYYNEYTEAIPKEEKYCSITYFDKFGSMQSLILLKGRNTEEDSRKTDYEQDHSDLIDTVESAVVTGGPMSPFESLTITISLKRLTSIYGEIATDIWSNSEKDGKELSVVIGKSEISYVGVGAGRYILSKYSSSHGKIKLEGYCPAAILSTSKFRGIYVAKNGPLELIRELVTTNLFMPRSYGKGEFISNAGGDSPELMLPILEFGINDGQNVWIALQYMAHMLNSRMFFTGRAAYLIDYVRIGLEPDNFNTSTNQAGSFSGNRLLIRDGLDSGEEIREDAEDWLSLNSFDLHNPNDRSRIGKRIDGAVSSPASSESTIYNGVTVKYRVQVRQENDTVYAIKVFGIGMYENEYGEVHYGEFTQEGETRKYTEDLLGTYRHELRADAMQRGEASSRLYGYHESSVDLTQTFAYLPDEYARAIAYSIFGNHIEEPKEVEFDALENYAEQLMESVTVEGQATKTDVESCRSSFWSAIFPNVCEVPRFIDREQELIISSKSMLVESIEDPLKVKGYRSEKNYLAKYSHKYPEYKSTYTFGTQAADTLASNINITQNKLESI